MELDQDANLVEVDALVPILIVPLHALYGHHLPCLLVYTLRNTAKTTVPQLIPHLVFLHSNQYVLC